MYWLTLSSAALLLACGATTAVSWQELGWYAVFAGNIYWGQIVGHWSTGLSHLWSLAVEEQFYLLIAPLLIVCGKRASLPICVVLLGVGVCQELHLVASGATDIRIATDSVIGFAVIALGGCLLWLSPKINWMTDTYALGLLTTYIALPLLFSRWPAGPQCSDFVTVLVAAAVIIAVERRPSSLAVELLEVRPLVLFGRVSYGFYIYHYWLTSDALYTMTFGVIDLRVLPNGLQIVALFCTTLVLAILSWFIIEKPMLALREGLLPRGASVGSWGGPLPAMHTPPDTSQYAMSS